MCPFFLLATLLPLLMGCHRSRSSPGTATVLIESSPNSLDPRIGVDAQAERIDALIFDSLVRKDEHFNLQPWLAKRWEHPDPLTYIFHLRSGVRFHNGQALTSADVAWTLDSLRNGSIVSPRSGNYLSIASVQAVGPLTVAIHLSRPDNALLWNLADGNFGVVPYGSGSSFGQHPVGTGPFEFVSQTQDRDVVLERNHHSWKPTVAPSNRIESSGWLPGGPLQPVQDPRYAGTGALQSTRGDPRSGATAPQPPAHIEHLRFVVVPDAITRALELRKGSADAEMNALTADMVYSLRNDPNLAIDTAPGTVLNYINFNLRDTLLADKRVRQAIACAIDRPAIIHALFRDQARLASGLLPIGHWAAVADTAQYAYDPVRARTLLDAVGFRPGANGIRMRLTMKTSTDETTRLLAAILQQQLRDVGIQLDLRSFEFGTFYGDITRSAFQMYALRWIGSNEDPDIFRYAYASASQPPHGANRGGYANAQLDSLLADAATTTNPTKRHEDYTQAQRILAEDVPTINLWFLDNVMVHTKRLSNIHLDPSGSYSFLRDATLATYQHSVGLPSLTVPIPLSQATEK